MEFVTQRHDNLTEDNNTNVSVGHCYSKVTNPDPFSIIHIIPTLLGVSVIAKLLWISTSVKKSPGVLNVNLLIFLTVQYCLSFCDFFFVIFSYFNQVKFREFLFAYALIGGPMNLSCICIERYMAVLYPTTYPLLKKCRFREMCSVAVWMLALGIALLKGFYAFDQNGLCVLGMASVFVLIGFWCNLNILFALNKPRVGTDKMHPSKKRAFRTVRITNMVVVVGYYPVTILWAFDRSQKQDHYVNCIVVPVCMFVLSVASIVPPLLNLCKHQKLLACLKEKVEE